MLQTDAAVFYGNSGGPLIGLDRKVVAVNTQIRSAIGGESTHISFGIPGDSVRKACAAILEFEGGEINRPFTGLPVDPEPWLPDKDEHDLLGINGGVKVKRDPEPETPAHIAGIRGGDIIIGIDEVTVDDPGDVFSWLLDHRCIGRKSVLKFIRDGKRHEGEVQPVKYAR